MEKLKEFMNRALHYARRKGWLSYGWEKVIVVQGNKTPEVMKLIDEIISVPEKGQQVLDGLKEKYGTVNVYFHDEATRPLLPETTEEERELKQKINNDPYGDHWAVSLRGNVYITYEAFTKLSDIENLLKEEHNLLSYSDVHYLGMDGYIHPMSQKHILTHELHHGLDPGSLSADEKQARTIARTNAHLPEEAARVLHDNDVSGFHFVGVSATGEKIFQMHDRTFRACKPNTPRTQEEIDQMAKLLVEGNYRKRHAECGLRQRDVETLMSYEISQRWPQWYGGDKTTVSTSLPLKLAQHDQKVHGMGRQVQAAGTERKPPLASSCLDFGVRWNDVGIKTTPPSFSSPP